jgi:hypothetical protein
VFSLFEGVVDGVVNRGVSGVVNGLVDDVVNGIVVGCCCRPSWELLVAEDLGLSTVAFVAVGAAVVFDR